MRLRIATLSPCALPTAFGRIEHTLRIGKDPLRIERRDPAYRPVAHLGVGGLMAHEQHVTRRIGQHRLRGDRTQREVRFRDDLLGILGAANCDRAARRAWFDNQPAKALERILLGSI